MIAQQKILEPNGGYYEVSSSVQLVRDACLAGMRVRVLCCAVRAFAPPCCRPMDERAACEGAQVAMLRLRVRE